MIALVVQLVFMRPKKPASASFISASTSTALVAALVQCECTFAAPPVPPLARCYLLELNGRKILLECGLYQGHRDEAIERNRKFPFNPREVDSVILSHAHIDHCGNLPNLCRQGFEGNIYCTFATRDLASVMLEDSAQIQRDDAAFLSKKRAKRGLPPN